ncbi:uncharacterized protein LOC141595950 [Silene latifolia]|uniref:uncharacterized protein LOC141595950 n=1 Tax=Silene latifolia TaxID=37657 RepID=UPI003D77DC2F
MAGRYGRKYAKNEDFEEGEVWGIMEDKKEMNNSISKPRKPMKDSSFFTNSSSSSRVFTAPRMIPKSSSSEVFTGGKKMSSAPLDIPDWSKIYGKTSKKNKNNSNNNNNIKNVVNDHHGECNNNYINININGYNNGHDGRDHYYEDDDEDDDDIDGMMPPHEYLARKLARNQISSFSVYEGIGRTLKGRDLSKVRNAILSKTGFLE